ncbi:cadmium-translocating P-type ATPase [Corynebacterium sp. CCM 9185]|uniref:Cadmium-translocating P-type ATPase n=1 Tax=Corynebacterium marambiense TaxID=2765364 RepID=A0ABS0VSU0_9CORY|nr:cation-translocating P-type ATPase [Corynebacterium marambiense]MBI8999850.1 cadmium-translocating P-type ATPase [Corynebacterium marambiense]MCK7662689.1 cadmium-translocating P-type ATPase [Corynebacterium marambiense]MCX7543700.1 cation-translocating P-type ATPase [Corynebacterium marambiense]
MSDACCGGEDTTTERPAGELLAARDEPGTPWWRDPALLVPLVSGVALLLGHLIHPGLFWIALILGGSRFIPQSMRKLITGQPGGRLGISLLMTISATGSVALGYVGEAAALAFLFSIAEALEERAMQKARAGLRSLVNLIPETVTVRRDTTTETIGITALNVGDTVIVRPGERIPTDGTVVGGEGALDTSAVTGESIPMTVGPGDPAPAGSIAVGSPLDIHADAPGTDNSLTTIVSIVTRAQAEKGTRARMADRVARPLVPGVLLMAVAVAAIGSLLGDSDVWIERALIVLVAASPCALAIAVPVTVISAIGAASRFGVIIKSGAAFERFGAVNRIAFDKTGTLTRNTPTVVSVDGPPDLLTLAAAVEKHSTHPLAAAVTAAVAEVDIPDAQDIEEHPGQGISGHIDGRRITVGSPRFNPPGALQHRVDELESDGRTVIVVCADDAAIGIIGIIDSLRDEAPDTITALHRMGMQVTMLTGDNLRTASAVGTDCGIRDIRAELLPVDKAAVVSGSGWAMVGDGINDAPALASADIGIAMGTTGTDAAIESADIAFTGHSLTLLPQALAHARSGRRIMNQNIALALAVILVLPPLALTGVLGLAMIVFIHEVAEIVIIINGLRASRTAVSTRR